MIPIMAHRSQHSSLVLKPRSQGLGEGSGERGKQEGRTATEDHQGPLFGPHFPSSLLLDSLCLLSDASQRKRSSHEFYHHSLVSSLLPKSPFKPVS